MENSEIENTHRIAMMSYLFTLSPGTFLCSDHQIAHILAISVPGPGERLCSHGELLSTYKGPERSLTLGPGNYHEGQRGLWNISPIPGDLSTLSIKGGNLGNFKFHVMWETIFWIRVMMILFNRQRPFKFLLTSTILFNPTHTEVCCLLGMQYIHFAFANLGG